MKRFIRYLYEYDRGKRIRNAGFVKIEAGNEETIVNMQGKGFHNRNERKLVLYLFYEENGKINGIRQAEVNLVTPVLSHHLTYTADDVGKPENYEKIKGIIVETADGKRLAATWDDKPVDVSVMEEYKSKKNLSVENIVIDNLSTEKLLAGGKESESGDSHPATSLEGFATEETGPSRSAEEETKLPRPVWDDRRIIKKIRRQELARLPRCEWKLANNQFLIYGYNNYHHLIWIQEGNVLKIGVPGIYHIKEAKVAETFGFGEFLSAEEMEISLEPEERHQDEPFGYWCRNVRRR